MSWEITTIVEWRPGVGDVFIDEIEKALGPMPEPKEINEEQPQVQTDL